MASVLSNNTNKIRTINSRIETKRKSIANIDIALNRIKNTNLFNNSIKEISGESSEAITRKKDEHSCMSQPVTSNNTENIFVLNGHEIKFNKCSSTDNTRHEQITDSQMISSVKLSEDGRKDGEDNNINELKKGDPIVLETVPNVEQLNH